MTDKPIYSSEREEPCLKCGEETAIGSVFFSDRREGTAPDGSRYFLCSECRKRVVPDDNSVDWSDPDVYLAVTAAAQFGFRSSWGLT
jgi:hypothetical protein